MANKNILHLDQNKMLEDLDKVFSLSLTYIEREK